MHVDHGILLQILLTIAVLIGTGLTYLIVANFVNRISNKYHYESNRKVFVRKILTVALLIFSFFFIVSIWGLNLKNIWIFVTSVVGLIAIGFFALWSILSNIIAGLLLYITNPIQIGKKVQIIPENIEGRVINIELMFVMLEDEDGNTFEIPNNMFFQRIIKTIKEN